jgi:hypothetical protein
LNGAWPSFGLQTFGFCGLVGNAPPRPPLPASPGGGTPTFCCGVSVTDGALPPFGLAGTIELEAIFFITLQLCASDFVHSGKRCFVGSSLRATERCYTVLSRCDCTALSTSVIVKAPVSSLITAASPPASSPDLFRDPVCGRGWRSPIECNPRGWRELGTSASMTSVAGVCGVEPVRDRSLQ